MTNYQLQIKSFVFGPFETNCYVVTINDQSPMTNDQSPMVLLVDPACSNEYERGQLEQYIENQKLKIKNQKSPITNHQSPITNNQLPITIVATHGHLDHLWGAAWACAKWNTPVLMHEADIPMAKAMQQQYDLFGADRLVFKTAQLYDYQNGHPLMPTNPKYSRYILGKDGKYHRRKLRKGCFRVWSGAVITTNGDVLPCCYDKSHAYAYGNIMEKPLRELFTSDKATAFRQAAFRQTPQICQECWK